MKITLASLVIIALAYFAGAKFPGLARKVGVA